MAYFEVNSIPYDVQQVMAIYNTNNESGTRQGLIFVLEEMRGYLTTDNDELDLTVDFPS